MDILTGLNPAQKDAVEAVSGPVLIIAGPGSGKTRVIAHRVAYLIKVCGVNPRHIMAVTFTNKAARELKERLSHLVSSSVGDLTLGTFHAICARILRIDGTAIGVNSNFVIYDDHDQMNLFKRSLLELELDPRQYTPRAISHAVSAAKSQLITAQLYQARSSNYFEEIVARVYQRYTELLKASNALDFDDLLLKTVQLLRQDEKVLAKYQKRYRHLLVDEFQDTNLVQYELVKMLSGEHRNICVVGDPDQSIYSWRFADIRNILNFKKDYPDTTVVLLEQNYRSTKTILDTASEVIASGSKRKRKLWTENEDGEPIKIVEAFNAQEEAQFVVNESEKIAGNGDLQMGDIAVMYRTNAQSRVLEEAFVRYGVPYRLVAGTRFYERREVKDIIAYLRLIANPDDSISLLRIVNVPGRGIGDRTLSQLSNWTRGMDTSEYRALKMLYTDENHAQDQILNSRSKKILGSFYETLNGLIEESTQKNVLELFDLVIERTGYQEYLQAMPDGDERWENIMELRSVASEYEAMPPLEGLNLFLENSVLVSDVDGMVNGVNAVTLITLHQAKGLEFPVVFMVGMEDNLLPHSRSHDDPKQMEEERRLCYVGITRARKRLYLVHAFRRSLMGRNDVCKPSRFLNDIPSRLVSRSGQWQKQNALAAAHGTDWNRQEAKNKDAQTITMVIAIKPGDRVRHTSFGEGTVVSLRTLTADAEVVVAFDDAGIKKLLLSLARLQQA